MTEQQAPQDPYSSAAQDGSRPPQYQPQSPSYGHGGIPQQGYPQQTPYAGTLLSPADQRMWAMLAHLGGTLFSFVPALVVWLVHKERGRFVAEQSKEALNFQLTLLIAYAGAAVAGGVLSLVTFGLGAFLPWIVWVGSVVFSVLAGVAANKGEEYRYPFSLRMVS